jgi:glycosyltransferase involved in cell wall biosynthesis
MKVVSVFTSFKQVGGAETIAYVLHNGMFNNSQRYLMSFDLFGELHPQYRISSKEYLIFSIKNIRRHRDFVFLSHHRKTTTYLILINRLLHLNLRIIHVAHNEFDTLKYLTFFPREIICVSNKVKDNHLNFFNLKSKRISTIYNGLEGTVSSVPKTVGKTIKILYLARISAEKRQIELVQELADGLIGSIEIHFAGRGDLSNKLNSLCQNSAYFKFIGFVDVVDVIHEFDYLMLFSTREGLPLSLIEAQKYGKPVIANDVGGNVEIIENGVNGFIVNSFEALKNKLNELTKIDQNRYNELSLNSAKNFEERFSQKMMIANYEHFIQNSE